eukprot:338052-Alexandrium_andersonii.AAC.1
MRLRQRHCAAAPRLLIRGVQNALARSVIDERRQAVLCPACHPVCQHMSPRRLSRAFLLGPAFRQGCRASA